MEMQTIFCHRLTIECFERKDELSFGLSNDFLMSGLRTLKLKNLKKLKTWNLFIKKLVFPALYSSDASNSDYLLRKRK